MNRRVVNTLIVVCVTLCCPCTVISSVSGVAFANAVLAVPEDVGIEVHAPHTVAKGEEFVVEIEVENMAEHAQSLDGVDISMEYLNEIEVQKSEPPFADMGGSLGMQNYYFHKEIPPGDTMVVRFFAISREAGEYPGEVHVCINSPHRCSYFDISTSVER